MSDRRGHDESWSCGFGVGFDSVSSLWGFISGTVGSGLSGESGNSSANDLVAPRIGLLSGDGYSGLIFGKSASAVDFSTSLAKLVLGSGFFVRLVSSRLGEWNSRLLT